MHSLALAEHLTPAHNQIPTGIRAMALVHHCEQRDREMPDCAAPTLQNEEPELLMRVSDVEPQGCSY